MERAERGSLRVRLLGGLDVRDGGVALAPLDSARAESLLAYLLLHRHAPQPRQQLAFTLWPDSTEAQARTNLRHVLHTLRRRLPQVAARLDVTPRTLQWRDGDATWVDVAAFEASLERAAQAGDGDRRAALAEAVALYGGELLAGRYDEWLLGERERLHQAYAAALAALAQLAEAAGDLDSAVGHAEQLLRDQPLHEESYRQLMRLHERRGNRARALRVYHECAAVLERELGVAPSATTRALYQALLTRDAAVAEAGPARPAGPPLVGRNDELEHLIAAWDAAADAPRLVLVTGEPGVGKTRLVDELRAWCVHHGAAAAAARSYRAEGSLAYAPVVTWLRSDSVRPALGRLPDRHRTELVRLLPELNVSAPAPPPQPLPEAEQRARLFDAVAAALAAVGTPLLLIADDVHWTDPHTLALAHYLLRHDAAHRLLVAATARSEDLPDNPALLELVTGLLALDRVTQLPLSRLGPSETVALAEHVGGAPFTADAAAILYGQTEGNPLFVVESVRAGADGGVAPQATTPRVTAMIAARLAQLSPAAGALVGVAATVGRAFTAAVVEAASGADEATLVAALDELWRRGIIREQPGDAYDFSHDKIREAAYDALSPQLRRRQHLAVARALVQVHRADADDVAGQVAAHFARGGAADEAVTWAGRAAEAAARLHANAEAVQLLERALDLLASLPPTAGRDRRELALLTALPAPLVALEGYTSPRVQRAQQRALDLAEQLGVAPEPPMLRSLAIGSLVHDDFAAAHRFAAQLHARGHGDRDPVLIVEGAYVLGVAAFWQAQLDAARTHLSEAVARSRDEDRPVHLLRYGQDPRAMCGLRLAYTLGLLGETEAARGCRDEALALARRIDHPYTLESALVWGALVSLEMGDEELLRACSAELAVMGPALAPHTALAGAVLSALVAALDGAGTTAVTRIRDLLRDAAPESLRAPGLTACLHWLLLRACHLADDVGHGVAVAEQLAERGGVQLWRAEAHRFRGLLLRGAGADPSQVDAALRTALQVAQDQGVPVYAQRAAAELAGAPVAEGA